MLEVKQVRQKAALAVQGPFGAKARKRRCVANVRGHRRETDTPVREKIHAAKLKFGLELMLARTVGASESSLFKSLMVKGSVETALAGFEWSPPKQGQ